MVNVRVNSDNGAAMRVVDFAHEASPLRLSHPGGEPLMKGPSAACSELPGEPTKQNGDESRARGFKRSRCPGQNRAKKAWEPKQ
jgi:hypothetical protein